MKKVGNPGLSKPFNQTQIKGKKMDYSEKMLLVTNKYRELILKIQKEESLETALMIIRNLMNDDFGNEDITFPVIVSSNGSCQIAMPFVFETAIQATKDFPEAYYRSETISLQLLEGEIETMKQTIKTFNFLKEGVFRALNQKNHREILLSLYENLNELIQLAQSSLLNKTQAYTTASTYYKIQHGED